METRNRCGCLRVFIRLDRRDPPHHTTRPQAHLIAHPTGTPTPTHHPLGARFESSDSIWVTALGWKLRLNWLKEIQSGTYRAARSVFSRLLSSLAVSFVSCPPPAPSVVGLWSRLSARCRLASSSFLCQEVMNFSAPCSTAECQGTPPSTFAASVHFSFGAVFFGAGIPKQLERFS